MSPAISEPMAATPGSFAARSTAAGGELRYQLGLGQVGSQPTAALVKHLRLAHDLANAIGFALSVQRMSNFDFDFGVHGDVVFQEGIKGVRDASARGILVRHHPVVAMAGGHFAEHVANRTHVNMFDALTKLPGGSQVTERASRTEIGNAKTTFEGKRSTHHLPPNRVQCSAGQGALIEPFDFLEDFTLAVGH